MLVLKLKLLTNKKEAMKIIISTITMSILVISAMSQAHTEVIMNDYLKIKNSLVKSDSDQAKLFALDLTKVLEAEVSFSEKPKLVKFAKKISSTNDIEKQREAFSELSVSLWKVIKNANTISGDIYYQYCPMKQMYWLSAEPVINNPYYGSKMLTCGSIFDKKLK